jgi:dipeptidyl aminopeptidase/acylaminoacyl peptidase
MHRSLPFVLLATLALLGCQRGAPAKVVTNPPVKAATLAEARQGFKTSLARRESANFPSPNPPPNVFTLVKYESPAGKLSAYVTPDPKNSKKNPAIIWITGGDCNSVDDSIWKNAPINNDQTAAQYRKAGIVMMFPTLRGGNDNPGVREGFLGEIDDVIAAAEYLAKLDYVDPARIYLGGHSTGGTTVMLVAECSNKFRATFSFGPAEDVGLYPDEFTPFNRTDRREVDVRSPGKWLGSIKTPVFVFEGTEKGSNLHAIQIMARDNSNAKVRFFQVNGAGHFNLLEPLNRHIASKILSDDGPECNITFTEDEINQAFRK